MTLVVQGFTLPLLIRILRVTPHPEADDLEKERELRLLLANNTLIFIESELQSSLSEEGKSLIRKPYLDTIAFLNKHLSNHEQERVRHITGVVVDPRLAAQQEIQQFQRKILIGFYKEGTFSQSVLRRIEQELDHAELLTGKLVKKRKML
jgi:CPA1 family monovalent cation:H+ antiporter